MNTGKIVTIGILGIAVVMASVAWWNNWNKGHRALSYWGSENAYQIRLAKHVTLYQLSDATTASDDQGQLDIGAQLAAIQSERDISQARGLVHARQALIQDSSYNWQSEPAANPRWQYAIRFGEGDSASMVLFDLRQATVSHAGATRPLSMNLGPGLKTLFDEQMGE